MRWQSAWMRSKPEAASPVSRRRLYRLDLPGGSHVYRYLTAEDAARDYPDAVLDDTEKQRTAATEDWYPETK